MLPSFVSFFNAMATTYIYSLSLHDALPICPSQFATRRTLFHVLVGCGLLMLKVSRLKLPEREKRSEERFSRNAETDLVCRLLLEKKKLREDSNWSSQTLNYQSLSESRLRVG